ncbi:uncharacterized protein LOC110230122 [Arabidopsis lyrata subsp. lyrata]|uniref:uncharacterized protein LOC110230122 n=1 Tax=Arabidopsis lyrata subsp. lyrata TaxID=81972 RepID=UPI000A29DD27|nr:uncharacterized protein LOC110230122 [Arabidopsis lyrata subsp. lyrata]|eukprot:XP_020887775.1 uncharacterized protein LOC110230122 [Arabidopsis lyrata subsp. lyrata]
MLPSTTALQWEQEVTNCHDERASDNPISPSQPHESNFSSPITPITPSQSPLSHDPQDFNKSYMIKAVPERTDVPVLQVLNPEVESFCAKEWIETSSSIQESGIKDVLSTYMNQDDQRTNQGRTKCHIRLRGRHVPIDLHVSLEAKLELFGWEYKKELNQGHISVKNWFMV